MLLTLFVREDYIRHARYFTTSGTSTTDCILCGSVTVISPLHGFALVLIALSCVGLPVVLVEYCLFPVRIVLVKSLVTTGTRRTINSMVRAQILCPIAPVSGTLPVLLAGTYCH